MLPSLSLTMFMLFFTVVEVARVRNSRNMMAWSLLLAAFSKVSALSFQYLFWSHYSTVAKIKHSSSDH